MSTSHIWLFSSNPSTAQIWKGEVDGVMRDKKKIKIKKSLNRDTVIARMGTSKTKNKQTNKNLIDSMWKNVPLQKCFRWHAQPSSLP